MRRITAFILANRLGATVGAVLELLAAAGIIFAVSEGGGEAYRILLLLYWPLSVFVAALPAVILDYLHVPDAVGWPIAIAWIVLVGMGVWALLGAGLQSVVRRLRTNT